MELSKDTKFKLSIETMIAIVVAVSTSTAFYYSVQAQISEAMQKPEPVISRDEFDFKDKAIRTEIMNNRELIEKNYGKLEIIEQRIFELKK